MEIVFMNTENSTTNKSNKFSYDFTDKLNFENSNKNIVLVNLSIYYIRKNIKSIYNNSKFKISATTWDYEFDFAWWIIFYFRC